jgi:Protein of unknown function (DUF3071)
MTDLRIVDIESDGRVLIAADDDGNEYRLPIDDKTVGALRRASGRESQVSDDSTALSPREIQTRLRLGASPESLAEQTGTPLERIERYATPVLAERAHAAETARSSVVRGADAATLDELVGAWMRSRQLDPESAEWDAYRMGDSRWAVVLDIPVGKGNATLRWTYDPVARAVSAADDDARRLVDGEAVNVSPTAPVVSLSSVRSVTETTTIVREELELDTDGDGVPDTLIEVEDVQVEVDEIDEDGEEESFVEEITTLREIVAEPFDDGPPIDEPVDGQSAIAPDQAEEEPKPAARKRSKSSRAKVPSWDDIVFGSRTTE